MLETSAYLDTLGKQLRNIYAARTGMNENTVQKYMDGEKSEGTFFDAEAAVKLGFATEIAENKRAAACIGSDIYCALPAALLPSCELDEVKLTDELKRYTATLKGETTNG